VAEIGLVDVSVRDGNQSLWGATGLDTAQMLQVAAKMDRAGFRAIDFTSSSHMAVAVRYFATTCGNASDARAPCRHATAVHYHRSAFHRAAG
jgi:isopropylmalate/homocitrate/citramalate synthase